MSRILPLAAGAIAIGVLLRSMRPHGLLRFRLRLGALSPFGMRLANVRCPAALLPKDLRGTADAEGLVACAIDVTRGKISAVHAGPTAAAAAAGSGGALDLGGAMLCSCFVAPHPPLVKTHTVPRNRNPTGSINDALACEMDDQPRWSVADDVGRRMDFALRSAWHHGVRAARTHLGSHAGAHTQHARHITLAMRR